MNRSTPERSGHNRDTDGPFIWNDFVAHAASLRKHWYLFYLCVYRDATFLLELKTIGSSWNCYLGGKLAHNYFSYPDRSLPQPFVNISRVSSVTVTVRHVCACVMWIRRCCHPALIQSHCALSRLLSRVIKERGGKKISVPQAECVRLLKVEEGIHLSVGVQSYQPVHQILQRHEGGSRGGEKMGATQQKEGTVSFHSISQQLTWARMWRVGAARQFKGRDGGLNRGANMPSNGRGGDCTGGCESHSRERWSASLSGCSSTCWPEVVCPGASRRTGRRRAGWPWTERTGEERERERRKAKTWESRGWEKELESHPRLNCVTGNLVTNGSQQMFVGPCADRGAKCQKTERSTLVKPSRPRCGSVHRWLNGLHPDWKIGSLAAMRFLQTHCID